MTRTLLISAGISCLIGGIIFMYFKNRMGRAEKKVDLMFQLIQEYEQTKSNHQEVSRTPPLNEMTDNIDLINVSDDDSSDGSDSDEVSDDEEEETIRISDNIDKNNIKSINLEGAETNSFPVDNLDDISDLEENEIDLNNENINNSKVEIEFKEKNEETSDEENLTDDEDNDEADVAGVADVVDVAADVADVAAVVADDVTSKANDLQSTIKQIFSEADNSLNGLSVKQLKQMCETQGFTNYKALRKNKLIELLQN
jgi:hypothetical protein